MNVIIVGSGAVAAELTSYIADQNIVFPENPMNLVGYLEYPENVENYWAKYKLKLPVIGDVLRYDIEKDDCFIVAIANLSYRKKIIETLKNRGGKVIGFQHHSAIVAESASLGMGNIVYPFCIIGPNTKLGDHNLITSYSFISHDCIVGDNNFFSTAGLGGMVIIGDDNFFGIRSTVLPQISIGSDNIIQAGMIVDKDVENEATIFHRFKEKVIAVPKTS